jgi:hypothetical protein
VGKRACACGGVFVFVCVYAYVRVSSAYIKVYANEGIGGKFVQVACFVWLRPHVRMRSLICISGHAVKVNIRTLRIKRRQGIKKGEK